MRQRKWKVFQEQAQEHLSFQGEQGDEWGRVEGERSLQRLMCGAQTLESFEHSSQHFPREYLTGVGRGCESVQINTGSRTFMGRGWGQEELIVCCLLRVCLSQGLTGLCRANQRVNLQTEQDSTLLMSARGTPFLLSYSASPRMVFLRR